MHFSIKSILFLLVALFLIYLSSCEYYKPTRFETSSGSGTGPLIDTSAKIVEPPADTIDQTITTSSFITASEIKTFLGVSHDSIILVYTGKASGRRNIRWVDFTLPVPYERKLPTPDPLSHADSPLISPDGRWVVYTITWSTAYAAYVQRLNTQSTPILISDKGSDPHWWTDPNNNELYIIYAESGKFIDPTTFKTSDGATYKQKVDLSASTVGSFFPGDPVKIADKNFLGGLSPDGTYLATGYSDAALLDISNTSNTVSILNSGLQVCNASISTDPAHDNWMLFLNFQGDQNLNNNSLGFINQHAAVMIVDETNTLQWHKMVLSGMDQWQDPEWTNDPNIISTLGRIGSTDNWDIYAIKISDKTEKKINITSSVVFEDTATPFLWIKQ